MKRYKVTRTWYVAAESIVDAVEKTKKKSHDKVRIVRMKCRECGAD